MIHPFTLRRKKEQVLKELPPKIEDIRRCSLSEDQIRLYKDVVENQGRDLVQGLKDPDRSVSYIHVFAVLNYLKQICDHPAIWKEKQRTTNVTIPGNGTFLSSFWKRAWGPVKKWWYSVNM